MAPLPPRLARVIRYGVAALIGLGASAAIVASTTCWLDAPSAWAEPPKAGYPPDPPGLATTKHWLFDIQVDKGFVSLARVREITLKNPEPTQRVMGRYALELWIGSELLDRLRFNVPLGGNLPREDDGRPFKRPSFDKVTAKFQARLGDQPRAVYLKLVDRATGEEKRYLWPPNGESLTPYPGGDAGKADAGKADAGKPDAGKPDAGKSAKDGGAAPAPSGSARPDAGPPGAAPAPSGSTKPDAGPPEDAPLVPRKPVPQPLPAPPKR